ncbi:MAG: hypothetical protein HY689_04955 [Chloroflexi bacterium]|nr:hypothetical protein [Chloroflexota bacterium]
MSIVARTGRFLADVIVGQHDKANRWLAVQRVLFGIVVVAAVGFGAYFFGLTAGQGQLTAQRTEYEARLQQAEAEKQQVQQQAAAAQRQAQEQIQAETQAIRARLATAEATNGLLLARGWLYRAAVELDRRNFGLANDHLRQAAQALRPVNPAAAAVEPARLQALRTAIEGTSVRVAEDLEVQRTTVLQLAEQMDTLLTR